MSYALNWAARDKYLEPFEPSRRSLIVNIIKAITNGWKCAQ